MFRRKPSTDRKWKLILVSHTHWDREWYLPFQQFRANLVEMVDGLLDLMTSEPEYRYFTLDGQTIVLEDYLEVRPEREEELRSLIASGRILVGPWYVMPDEFLVSGESLVRNLLEGKRTAARFGPVMRVGYVPDPFGHIAQLPQLLRGFGIDSAVLWRGVGSDLRRTEARWESPDGSSVLLEHMPAGYGSAAVLPSSPEPLMERISQLRAQLQPRAATDLLLLMNGDDHMLPQSDVPAIIVEANRRLRGARLVHGTLPMLLEEVREQLSANGQELEAMQGELRSPELSHLLAGVLSARMDVKQRNAQCERLLERWAEPFSTFASILPRDAAAPAAPTVERRAHDTPALLRLAWRYLLKNHPHDSICGCSIDQVHREGVTRYDACQQIADLVTNRALETLAGSVDSELALKESPGKGGLVVFNPDAGPRTDFATATVELPGDRTAVALVAPGGEPVPWQVLREQQTELAGATLHRTEVQGYLRLSGPGKDWPVWKLKILEKVIRAALRGRMPDFVVASMDVVPGPDPSTVNVEVEVASGKEHDYGALSAGMRQITNLVERGDAVHFRLRVRRRDLVEIGFVARDLPGRGLKLLHFEAAAPPQPSAAHHGHPETTLENEFLSLQVSQEDGSARLIDRETGAIYWGLNAFVDGGEAGDEYTYSPPANDTVAQDPTGTPSITLEENGPARQLLRVETELMLPARLSDDRSSRSSELVRCPITSWLAIYPGVPRVDVRTTVVNTVQDHRLRVFFPTHLNAISSHAGGQFAVIERPVEALARRDDWAEQPVGTHPQVEFVDVSDGELGLMIANRGLPEYEVVTQERGSAIALTLLRCIGWLSRDDLATRKGAAGPMVATPGAQMQGIHEFDYSIIPHSGDWRSAIQHARCFANPLASRWTGRHRGPLAEEVALLSVSPPGLIVSAVKRPDDGGRDVIVRMYNVLGTPVEGSLKLFVPVKAAALATLAEEPVEPLSLETDGGLRFPAGPHQIVTVRLTPA